MVLAKGFIIIFIFFHRGKPAVHWSVTTADPHRVLLFHAFASLARGSGSDAVLTHLVHPDGMPVGHSVGSTRPTILCHSIPLSQHNGAGATNRLGIPAGLHWKQSVCPPPKDSACPIPWPHNHNRSGLPALLPHCKSRAPYYEPSGVPFIMNFSSVQYAKTSS